MGFVLVAVLCAVLMTLSVGRGWALDLFHAGKPIAAAAGGHLDRVPAPVEPPAGPAPVSIPEELSAQPLGVSVSGPVPAVVKAQADRNVDRQPERHAERDGAQVARSGQKDAEKPVRSTERAADRAARKG